MSQVAVERQLLTSKEAAHMLGISPRKLWGLTASGIVPCVRANRNTWGRSSPSCTSGTTPE